MITDEQRKKLAAIAKDLMDIWESLPNNDCEEGSDYSYRGGLIKLTVKGGYTDGWADLSWNDVITDIYAGEKLASIALATYEGIWGAAQKEK